MLSEIKKLFSHSVIYGLGNTAGKIVGFLLIPVYTRYLTPDDYGILSLCATFGACLFLFLNMGLSSAIFKVYFQADTEKDKNSILTTTGFLMTFISLPVSLYLLLKSAWISDILLGNIAYKNAIIIIVCTTFFTILLKLPFSTMRAKEESKKYATLSVIKTSITLILTILLVVGLNKGFWGIIISQCIAALLFCVYLLPQTLHNMPLHFSLPAAKKLLHFGLPLVGSGIGAFIITLSDRYLLKLYSTMDQIGLYSLGYRFGEILFFLVWAFQLAWPQFLFANQKSPDAQALYSRVSTYFIFVIIFVCLSVSMLAKEIIILMATPSFFEAYKIIPVIGLSQLFYGLYFLGLVGIYLKGKTKYLPLCVGIAAAVNLILNFIWIPKYGIMGAAVSTLIAYFIQFILSLIISMRLYSVPYEYTRILKIITVSIAIYFLSSTITTVPTSRAAVYKVLLLFLYPLGLLVSGFFTAPELARIKKPFQKITSL